MFKMIGLLFVSVLFSAVSTLAYPYQVLVVDLSTSFSDVTENTYSSLYPYDAIDIKFELPEGTGFKATTEKYLADCMIVSFHREKNELTGKTYMFLRITPEIAPGGYCTVHITDAAMKTATVKLYYLEP